MTGLSPVMLGVDLTAPIILGLTGKLADSLNHLVFTMPFLPSEGQPGKMMIDNEVQDVLLFRYLPSLWYTHPIPNNLREFWYTERLDIYNFMKKNYFIAILALVMGIFTDLQGNVAHFAHFGGMLTGFILLKIWNIKANSFRI